MLAADRDGEQLGDVAQLGARSPLLPHGRARNGSAASAASGGARRPGGLDDAEVERAQVQHAWLGFAAAAARAFQDTSFGVSIIPMSVELGWSAAQQGLALAALAVTYFLLQVPSGLCVLRVGPRLQILAGAAATVALNAATPEALELAFRSAGGLKHASDAANATIWCVIVLRALQGVANAALNPALHAMLGRWSTARNGSSSRMHNIMYAGSTGGAVLGLCCAGYICVRFGWQASFYANAAFSLVVAVTWAAFACDSPAIALSGGQCACGAARCLHELCGYNAPPARRQFADGMNALERERSKKLLLANGGGGAAPPRSLSSLPWGRMCCSAPLFALIVNHFAYDCASYLITSWGPTYLDKVLGFQLGTTGVLAALPYAAKTLVMLLSGEAVLRLIGRGVLSVTATRRIMQGTGQLCSAGLLALLGYMPSSHPEAALGVLVASVGLSGLCQLGHHVNHVDLAPSFASVLYGISNTVANTSGWSVPALAGWLIGDDGRSESNVEGWRVVFLLVAALQVVAGSLFVCFGSGRKQFD